MISNGSMSNGSMSNELTCDQKRDGLCTIDQGRRRICNPKRSNCKKPRNYDFEFSVKEAGQIPVMDVRFKRRENGIISQYTIKNVGLDKITMNAERFEWGGSERELVLPIYPFDPSYADMKIIKRRLTKKELEKELGHEVEIL